MLLSAYKTLRIPQGSSNEEIRAAYVRMVRRYPPENFPDRFRQIKEAYDHLSLAESYLDELYIRVREVKTPKTFLAMLFADQVELPPAQDNLQSLAVERSRPEDQNGLWEFLTKGLAGKVEPIGPMGH